MQSNHSAIDSAEKIGCIDSVESQTKNFIVSGTVSEVSVPWNTFAVSSIIILS